MLVRSLLLERYGAFAGRAIELGSGGLTLVIGPNEAGKSTALEALSDLLWGIPQRSGQTFLFARPALVLRAAVELGGEPVELVRTSAGLTRRDTGAPFDAGWQTDADSRERWLTSFGLSQDRLRAGGAQVCAGGGDLAELVFTARSGGQVRELLASLQSSADALYKEHKGNKNVAVRLAFAELEEARRQVDRATANSDTVRALRAEADDAESAVKRAERRAGEARHGANLAELRRRAAPHARRLAEVRARAALAAAGGTTLDDGQLEVYAEAAAALRAGDKDVAELSEQLAELSARRSGLAEAPALLADKDAIRRLQNEAEARLRDGDEAEELSRQAAGSMAEATDLLRDLVGGADPRPVPELLEALHVPADRAAQLDRLAADVGEAEQRLRTQSSTLADATKRRVTAEADAPAGALDDDAVAAVRDAHATVVAAGSAAAAQREAIAAGAEAQRRRAEALRLAGLSADAARPPSVPTARAVRDTSADLEAARIAWAGARARSDVLAADLGLLGEELARWRAEQPPSPGELDAARAERDGTIAELVDAWRQGGLASEAGDLAGLVGRSVARADEVADLLSERAGATARRDEVFARLERRRTEHEGALRELAEVTKRLEQAELCWAALWPRLGGATPPLAAEAGELRRRLEEAAAAEEDADAARSRVLGLDQQVGEQRAVLAEALRRAGHPLADADLETLLTAAGRLLAADDGRREQRARLAELRRLESTERAERDRCSTELDELVGQWRSGLAAAGVADDLDVHGWERRRDLLERARGHHRRAVELAEQAERHRRDHADFLAALGPLARRHGLPTDDPAGALGQLSDRLEDAVGARGSAVELDRRLEELAGDLEERRRSRDAARALLEALCRSFGLADLEELDELAGRSRTRRELADEERNLAQRIGELLGPAGDVGPDGAVGDEHLLDEPEVLDAAWEEAKAEVARAEEALKEAIAAQEEVSARRRNLEGAEGAAELEARAQEKLAAVAERVERYLVARVQAELLRGELDAYERAHASPLLDRAGEILERLTGGRYVALEVTEHAGVRGLAVVGADEQALSSEQLSEGTADQVFLALRLAGISSLQEQRRQRGLPALPVVLDDVLTTFDDERATAALRVLAEQAERWQVVLFSHHEHLGVLGQRLGPGALTVARVADPPARVARQPAGEIRRRARTDRTSLLLGGTPDAGAPGHPSVGPSGAGASTGPPGPSGRPSRIGTPGPSGGPSSIGTPGPLGGPSDIGTGRSGALQRGLRPVPPGGGADPADIREWARSHGYEVGERGRIPAPIRQAYERAHR